MLDRERRVSDHLNHGCSRTSDSFGTLRDWARGRFVVVTGASGTDGGDGDLAGLIVGPWPTWAPTFRLLGQLGDRGAEGTTYRAERLRREEDEFVPSGELVALKVFERDAFWRDTDESSRPLVERLTDLEDLAHTLSEVPGVVRFRSPFLGPVPQRPGVQPEPDDPRRRTYLPMELVAGPSLEQAIGQASDSAGRRELLTRLGSLAESLRGLHDARPDAPLAHRDVKPANLILDGDGLTLVDLGLLVSPQRSVTAGVGSFGFMAPEQQEAKRLEAGLAHRVDWFAFVATCASVLTGEQPPWSTNGWSAWLAEHPDITPRARDLLLTAAHASPHARPAPWAWFPSLLAATQDPRRVSVRSHLQRHRRALAVVAAASSALLAITGVGVTVANQRTHVAVERALPKPSPPKSATLALGVTLAPSKWDPEPADPPDLVKAKPGDVLRLSGSVWNASSGRDAHDVGVEVTTGPHPDGGFVVVLSAEARESPRAQASLRVVSSSGGRIVLLPITEPATIEYNTAWDQKKLTSGYEAPRSEGIADPLLGWGTRLPVLRPGAEREGNPARSRANLTLGFRVANPPAAAASPLALSENLRIDSLSCSAGTGSTPDVRVELSIRIHDNDGCWSRVVGDFEERARTTGLVVIRNATNHEWRRPTITLQLPITLATPSVMWRASRPEGPWRPMTSAGGLLTLPPQGIGDRLYLAFELGFSRDNSACDFRSDLPVTVVLEDALQSLATATAIVTRKYCAVP
jgi:serine/threonine protein kinase